MADPPLQECPECHQPTLKKQISAAGFRLKGGGWYETDFKAGNKKNLHGEQAEAVQKTPADKKPADAAKAPAASAAKPASDP